MILMARALWRELGLIEGQHVRLEINSLGQPDERRAHRDALVKPTSSRTAADWTPTPSAACTATRCASSTPRTRPCRR
jgi:hypothetical protein